MNFQYINEIIPLLEAFVQKYGGEVIPCTNKEVAKLESVLPNSYCLPSAFKEFLLYGGKKLGELFEGEHSPSYHQSLSRAENSRAIVASKVYGNGAKTAEIPEDVFVVSSHITSYVAYFRLTEGENPPIYSWSDEEEDKFGIEAIQKEHNSFTNFIKNEIRIRHLELIPYETRKKIETGNLHRGKQFWLCKPNEYKEGIEYIDMMNYFGFISYRKIEKAATTFKLDTYSYLEELSGWKARKVDNEVRFFPPSYESPEEKEKKAYLLQNQIESKKQELAKVEKRIINFQVRIKNLSPSKLTGALQFNDLSNSKIQELEKESRKQKVLKQNIERQIAELEKDMNS